MTRDVLTEREETTKTFRIVRFDEPKQNEPKSSRQALSVEKKREKREINSVQKRCANYLLFLKESTF